MCVFIINGLNRRRNPPNHGLKPRGLRRVQTVIDFMPPRSQVPELIRVVEGRRGRVPMHLEPVIRSIRARKRLIVTLSCSV